MTLQDQLKKLNACKDAQEWAKDFTTLKGAWEACNRGDWMLWIYARLRPNNLRELTLAKGHCANTVRHLMKDERSIRAVDTAIAFGEGRATVEELAAAAYAAADAAADAADAADAAYTAADVAYAADAAYTAADVAYAADAAADVATYAAVAAYADAAYADANYADARKANQKQTADICRKYLTQTMFA